MPDVVLHLGDCSSDAEDLSFAFENVEFVSVPGNCDYAPGALTSLTPEFDGVRIFMTHGHLFGVKRELGALLEKAKQAGAAVCLFGHTHQSLLLQQDGLWLMNPGAYSRCGYGLIETDHGKIRCSLHRSDET